MTTLDTGRPSRAAGVLCLPPQTGTQGARAWVHRSRRWGLHTEGAPHAGPPHPCPPGNPSKALASRGWELVWGRTCGTGWIQGTGPVTINTGARGSPGLLGEGGRGAARAWPLPALGARRAAALLQTRVEMAVQWGAGEFSLEAHPCLHGAPGSHRLAKGRTFRTEKELPPDSRADLEASPPPVPARAPQRDVTRPAPRQTGGRAGSRPLSLQTQQRERPRAL